MFFHWTIAEQLVEDRRNQLLADAATYRIAAGSHETRPHHLRHWLRRFASNPSPPRTHRDPATANLPAPPISTDRRTATSAPCKNAA
jgi:hypothetical protein